MAGKRSVNGVGIKELNRVQFPIQKGEQIMNMSYRFECIKWTVVAGVSLSLVLAACAALPRRTAPAAAAATAAPTEKPAEPTPAEPTPNSTVIFLTAEAGLPRPTPLPHLQQLLIVQSCKDHCYQDSCCDKCACCKKWGDNVCQSCPSASVRLLAPDKILKGGFTTEDSIINSPGGKLMPLTEDQVAKLNTAAQNFKPADTLIEKLTAYQSLAQAYDDADAGVLGLLVRDEALENAITFLEQQKELNPKDGAKVIEVAKKQVERANELKFERTAKEVQEQFNLNYPGAAK